jgi:hypothetical protein
MSDDLVVHRLDPLKRKAKIINQFFWLGHLKIQVQYPNGEYATDWVWEWTR